MPEDHPDKAQRLVPLRVEPIDHESLSYHVEKEDAIPADGETWLDHAYRVDLETLPVADEFGNDVRNGSCTCSDFEYRKHKQAELGILSECKHIAACLIYYARQKVVEESLARKSARKRSRIFQGLKQ
jgi:hypothetical protein